MNASQSDLPSRRRLLVAGLLLLAAACAATPENPPSAPASGDAAAAPPLSAAASNPSRPDALPSPPLPAAEARAREEILAVADEALRRAPQPRQAITTQGLMFTDRAYVESTEAKRDWYAMLALALAARETQQGRYSRAYSEYLDAWLAVFRPGNDPISESDFHFFVLAAEMQRGQLSAEQLQGLGRLFRGMVKGYLDPATYPVGTVNNNWQSHRIKLASLMAFSLGDEELLKRCRGAFRKQIAENLRADGVVSDFVQRDALRYATYSLEPLLLAALVAQEHGQDWFAYESPSGSSLNRSLRWLAEYASGRKTHEEFRNTTVEFDRRRAAAGVPGFTGLWQPTSAAPCYQLAARLNPEWRQFADLLDPGPAWIAVRFPSR